MTALSAIILGVIEGVTEFLPISSTAHLILAGDLLRLPQTEFLKTFEVAIQLGAILAVLVLYGKDFLVEKSVAFKVLTAFIPTAVVGLALHEVIKNVFFESTALILWSLFLGGIVIIAFEQWHTEKKDAIREVADITYAQAFIIGVFQSVAVVPGVSRAAATVIGGLAIGIGRATIVRFSFLLAVPTMLAATVLDLAKSGSSFAAGEYLLLGLGFVTAFATALVAITWLLTFLKKHTFTSFGVYRILAAAAGWLLLR